MDGLTLYAVSSDGTMAVFSFDPEELEGLAPLSVQEKYLAKFGFTPPPLPTGFSHTVQPSTDQRMTPPPSPKRVEVQARAPSEAPGFGSSTDGLGGERINQLVAKRKTKKRVQPTFVGGFGGANIPSAMNPGGRSSMQTSASESPSVPVSTGRSFHEITGIASSSRIQPQLSASSTSMQSPIASSHTFGEDPMLVYPDSDSPGDMNTDVQISSLDTGGRKGKRKASTVDFVEDRPFKARTLGGDRVREVVTVKELSSRFNPPEAVAFASTSVELSLSGRLPLSSLLNYVKASVEGTEDMFEGRNYVDVNTPTEVLFVSGKQTQWLDYLPSPVLALTATASFCAAATQDGTVTVYSPTGRKYVLSIVQCV